LQVLSLAVFALYALRHLRVLSNPLQLFSVSESRVAARAQPYGLPAASFDPTSLPWPNQITRISQRLASAANRFGDFGEQIESMKHRLADSIILKRGG
jgi:hypothetical protein